jgi:hypothetical protein
MERCSLSRLKVKFGKRPRRMKTEIVIFHARARGPKLLHAFFGFPRVEGFDMTDSTIK